MQKSSKVLWGFKRKTQIRHELSLKKGVNGEKNIKTYVQSKSNNYKYE